MKNRPTFFEWAKELVDSYAARGTCSRRQAAAVGFDADGRIQGIGMNGVPRDFPHCIDEHCPGADDPPGMTENCLAIHAEQNMILNSHDPFEIVDVFVSVSPCKTCALLLCNLPRLKRVVFWEEYADKRGILLLHRKGIQTLYVEGDTHPGAPTLSHHIK